MHLDDTANVLGSAEFFGICNLEQRRMLAFASEWIQLKAGDVLFKAGQVSPGAYVLVSGELTSTPKSGSKEKSVAITEPGTVIGELALIVKGERRASVVCKSNAQLLMVPRSAFLKLMQQFPEIAAKAQEQVRSDIEKYISPIEQVSKVSGLKK